MYYTHVQVWMQRHDLLHHSYILPLACFGPLCPIFYSCFCHCWICTLMHLSPTFNTFNVPSTDTSDYPYLDCCLCVCVHVCAHANYGIPILLRNIDLVIGLLNYGIPIREKCSHTWYVPCRHALLPCKFELTCCVQVTSISLVNSYSDDLCQSSLLTALYCEPPKWVCTDLSLQKLYGYFRQCCDCVLHGMEAWTQLHRCNSHDKGLC